jgi:polyphosphate kinase 2 (PPK2 family)
MRIDLGNHESGKPFDGVYAKTIAGLQSRLERIQVAHIVHRKSAILVFEGWDAAGKGGIIKRLAAEWDPRWFAVHPIAAPTPEEKARHYLWRFWTRLPAAGQIAIFDRSWYGRVLVERVGGFAQEAEWRCAYDEINAFEAEQAANGTTILKLFVHVTQETQDRELLERVETPHKRWKFAADDLRNRARRPDYLEAMADMFARTDTGHAPWLVIDGNNRKAGRIAALTAIADRLEANVEMAMPHLDPALEAEARRVLATR